MHKTLKFVPELVPLVLNGEKNSTWRLWDDKSISVGDKVDLLNKADLTHFATATITKVLEKPLGELTEEDKKGHETFKSDEQMYQTYTKYYNRPVDSTTPVKLIWFELTM